MKPAFWIGVVLIILGVVVLICQGIPYTRHNTTVIGPLEIKTQHQQTLPIPPILGGISLAGGVLLVVVGSKK